MPVHYDRNSLEDYQQNLFDFIAAVPEGEPGLESGPPEQNDKAFEKLTGMTQAKLDAMWVWNPTYTTCNDFCIHAAQAMGVTQVNTGQFEVASWLAAVGLARAWAPDRDGARPRYGDIFRSAGIHRGVSLECEGDVWNTIEAGQGGKGHRKDAVKRFSRSWSHRDILGWIDVGMLRLQSAPLPSWLGGWWEVNEEPDQHYYYFFEAGGKVYWTQDSPELTGSSTLLPPPVNWFHGAFSIVRGFQTVAIHWHSIDPVETIQVSTSLERIDQWTRAANMDRFRTLPGQRPIISGRRLPGPAHTGRSS